MRIEVKRQIQKLPLRIACKRWPISSRKYLTQLDKRLVAKQVRKFKEANNALR